MRTLWPTLIAAGLLSAACSPKIYVIDRQTALEEEAAGQWPQFDKQLLRRSASGEPVPFGKVPVTARKQRLYNVLNGEMPSTETASAPNPNGSNPNSTKTQSGAKP